MAQEISLYQAERRQSKIKNILFHTATTTYTTQFCESYIPNNQTNKHNPNNQNNNINVGFTTNTKFLLLLLRQRIFWSIHIQISQKFDKFVHFIDPEKPVCGLMNNFVHFIHPYKNPLPSSLSCSTNQWTGFYSYDRESVMKELGSIYFPYKL